MAQFPADPQQKPVSATVPFPATWNAPPEYHDMVIAIRISGLSEKGYNSITVAIGKQYMFDEMRFRDAMQSNPIRPEPIKGFSNQYAPTENGGTAYLRIPMSFRERRGNLQERLRGYYQETDSKSISHIQSRNRNCAKRSPKEENKSAMTVRRSGPGHGGGNSLRFALRVAGPP